MKVLIVHPCKGFYGGAEEVVAQFHRYLVRKENTPFETVRVILKDMPKDLKRNLEGWGRFENTNTWYGMWQEVRKNLDWADVICCFNFPATLAAFPTKKPIVWYCNEPPELFTNWWRKPIETLNRWWVRKSGMKVIVATKYDRGRFKGIYGVAPTVIPYGIDYTFWSQGIRSSKELILLQVGHPELFPQGEKIFNEVQKSIPSTRLIQVTGGTHEDVRNRYYEASVLIHPIESHGGWLVALEAMCTGLPVIVSPQFTGADIVRRLELGIITDDIAGSILAEEYHVIDTKAAKEWVKENLTWEKFGEGMIRVFKGAIDVEQGKD